MDVLVFGKIREEYRCKGLRNDLMKRNEGVVKLKRRCISLREVPPL
jgi:hypothetical protein